MPGRNKTARRISLALLRLAIGIGLMVYLAESRIIDFRLLEKLTTALPITIGAMSLIFLDIVLMALRLCLLFRPQGLQLWFASSLELTLISSFFTTFLPGSGGGDLAKLFYVTKGNKGRRTEIMTTVVLDRVVGLSSLLLLPLLFAPLFSRLIRSERVLQVLLVIATALLVCLLAAFLLCICKPTSMNRVARVVSRFLPGEKIPERVIQTIGAYRTSPHILIIALGVSLVSNLLLVATIAMAIWLLSPNSFSLKLCLVIPLGDIANGLPLTPGGLGVGETAFNALFKIVGIQGGADALVCWRIWRALVGLVGLILYLRGVERVAFRSKEDNERSKDLEILGSPDLSGDSK